MANAVTGRQSAGSMFYTEWNQHKVLLSYPVGIFIDFSEIFFCFNIYSNCVVWRRTEKKKNSSHITGKSNQSGNRTKTYSLNHTSLTRVHTEKRNLRFSMEMKQIHNKRPQRNGTFCISWMTSISAAVAMFTADGLDLIGGRYLIASLHAVTDWGGGGGAT